MTDMPKGGAPRRPSDEEILTAIPRGVGGGEARVGLFVLIGLVSFVVVLFLMTDPSWFRGRRMLVTTVDHAGGVRSGDPVQMQGVNVGRVNSFEMVGTGQVNIRLEIERGWEIPRGSRAVMGAAGLFGGLTIEIIRGDGEGFYEAWDTLPGEGASGGGLLGSVDELSEQAISVLSSIDALLDPETVGGIQEIVLELRQLLGEVSAVTQEQRGALGQLTESLLRSAEGFEVAAAAGPDVVNLIARADSALAVLVETGASLDAAIESVSSILARIEAGEGLIGKLVNDELLYDNLNLAIESFASLVQDLQANPNKYINFSLF